MHPSAVRKKRFRSSTWSRFWIPLILVVSSILLGWIGFYQYFRAIGRPMGVGNAFFYAAGLPIMQTTMLSERLDLVPPVLNVARALGLVVVPYAFVLAFLALFGDLTKPVRIRSWRWRSGNRTRGHTVVCGLGGKGYEIARDLMDSGRRVAVAEADAENPLILLARERGAVVLEGDATQPPVLRDLDLLAAEKVFILCGSDATNVRVLRQIGTRLAAAGDRETPIECSVEIRDPRTRDFAHRALSADPRLYVNSFDSHEATARQLLDAYPIDRPSADPAGGVVNVIILGYTPIARAILFQSLLLGHFRHPRILHVTVLTEDEERDRKRFLADYPCFLPDLFGDDPSAEALRRQVLPSYEFARLPQSDAVLLDERQALMRKLSPGSAASLFVCVDEGLRSAAYVSSILPSVGLAASQRGADVRVSYYHEEPERDHRASVERSLRELVPGLPVISFDNFLDGCSVDRVEGRPADDLAREIARFYRQEYGGEAWRNLTEADRMANRRAADHVPVKLRAIGAAVVDRRHADPGFTFTEEEIGLLAEMEHRRWSAEKLLTGWRPLQRTTANQRRWNADKALLKAQKLHIDLVPFEELTDYEKGKDRSQILGIPSFLEALGRGITRTRSEPL